MDPADIAAIAQGPLAIMNPTTEKKILEMGKRAGLGRHSHVVEFGCGNGTLLTLWAEEYGISGTGIEINRNMCETARNLVCERQLEDHIEIIHGDAREFCPGQTHFDLAVSLGASHIWGGTGPALAALNAAVEGTGKMVLGERYWRVDRVAPEFAREWQEIPTEYELLGLVRECGYDLAGVMRASEADWDCYETAIWQSCLDFISKQGGGDGAEGMTEYLHSIQDEYLAYGREYIGWAMYLCIPRPEIDNGEPF